MANRKGNRVKNATSPEINVQGTEEVLEEEILDVEAEDKNEPEAIQVVSEPLAKVKLKQDFSAYIGNQWYRFKGGVVTSVPANVKEILQRAGMLDAI